MGLTLIVVLILMFQPVMAAEQSNLGDIKNDADQALQNVSKVTNDTAQEVQDTINPIQDIINTISSILQQIQQIMQNISYITGGGNQ